MMGEGKELDVGKFCSKMQLRGPIVSCLLKDLTRKINLKNVTRCFKHRSQIQFNICLWSFVKKEGKQVK